MSPQSLSQVIGIFWSLTLGTTRCHIIYVLSFLLSPIFHTSAGTLTPCSTLAFFCTQPHTHFVSLSELALYNTTLFCYPHLITIVIARLKHGHTSPKSQCHITWKMIPVPAMAMTTSKVAVTISVLGSKLSCLITFLFNCYGDSDSDTTCELACPEIRQMRKQQYELPHSFIMMVIVMTSFSSWHSHCPIATQRQHTQFLSLHQCTVSYNQLIVLIPCANIVLSDAGNMIYTTNNISMSEFPPQCYIKI